VIRVFNLFADADYLKAERRRQKSDLPGSDSLARSSQRPPIDNQNQQEYDDDPADLPGSRVDRWAYEKSKKMQENQP